MIAMNLDRQIFVITVSALSPMTIDAISVVCGATYTGAELDSSQDSLFLALNERTRTEAIRRISL